MSRAPEPPPPADHAAPPAASVFEPVHDRYGLRLALVLGNQAPGGVCPWAAAGRCHHCDIGLGEGRALDAPANLARLAWLLAHHAADLERVAHLVVYDSGSVLNPRELAPEVLDAVLAAARGLPAARVVSLDTREAFVTGPALARVAGALGPGLVARITLGLESADDRVREGALAKRMPLAAVARAIDALGQAEAALGPGRFGLDVNVLVGGPGTTPATTVDDAVATARWAAERARAAGLGVDLNVHPYYPSARGLGRFPDHPRCPPELTARAVLALTAAARALAPGAGVFVGWQDEGHDHEPARRDEELARARAAFDAFNRGQDPGALAPLLAR
ncbi:MAG: hypothetical protein M9894_14265 [Planctomycetes bacterium]|nr:hypothetical protein [Planctomycetota bacterium]